MPQVQPPRAQYQTLELFIPLNLQLELFYPQIQTPGLYYSLHFYRKIQNINASTREKSHEQLITELVEVRNNVWESKQVVEMKIRCGINITS